MQYNCRLVAFVLGRGTPVRGTLAATKCVVTTSTIWPERPNRACSYSRPNYACNRVPGAWLRYCLSPRPINVLGDGNRPVYYHSRDRLRHQAQVDRRATAAVRRRSASPYGPARRVSFSESLCENPRLANRVPTHSPSRPPAIADAGRLTVEAVEVCLNLEPRFVSLLLTRYSHPTPPAP